MGSGGSTSHHRHRSAVPATGVVRVSPRDQEDSCAVPVDSSNQDLSSPGKCPSPLSFPSIDKALKYEIARGVADTHAQEMEGQMPLTQEFWNKAKQNYWEQARKLQRDRDPSVEDTPRSELSSLASSDDSSEEYCVPGRRESLSCGVVMLREQPRPFSKSFSYVEHELKVKRTKLCLVPVNKEDKSKRPIKVFKLSNIEKVDMKEDQGFSLISLQLSPHLAGKIIVLAVDKSESEVTQEWVEALTSAVQKEQNRAAKVKQEFKDMLQKQNLAWQRRPSRPCVEDARLCKQ